jgi:hypothetical protein
MDDSCLSCGRDTAPGTPLFSARKRALDTTSGAEGVLCQACQPGSAGLGGTQTVPLSGRYVVIDFPGGGPAGIP